VSPLTTDEIHEKYLQKAISEINELAHEVAQAAGELRVPVVGSGHPLADIMLVKYRPQATEAQEGVAFYGRSGSALIKSLQRLRVDPLAVYGTNCLKFADGEDDESRPWLLRELHIVQPKLIVLMGEDALGFVNSLELALSRALEARVGALQQLTPTIEALLTPDIDQSLDEQAAKTKFWNAFKLVGSWWAELPPY
jgi:uracil-DNA glycosylase family 4